MLFDEDEGGKGDQSQNEDGEHPRIAQAPGRRLDKGVDQTGEPARSQDRASQVEPAGLRVTALRHMRKRDRDRHDGHRRRHQERRPPGYVFDQQSAKDRTYRHRKAAERSPGTDGPRPLLPFERRPDDRQRRRHQQRPSYALHSPGRDELAGYRDERAPQRARTEDRRADDEEAPPSEAVSQGASDEYERREHQGESSVTPLHLLHARPELSLQCGQGNVHYCAVEEGHARAKGRGRYNPGPGGRHARRRAPGGTDDANIASREDGRHYRVL